MKTIALTTIKRKVMLIIVRVVVHVEIFPNRISIFNKEFSLIRYILSLRKRDRGNRLIAK